MEEAEIKTNLIQSVTGSTLKPVGRTKSRDDDSESEDLKEADSDLDERREITYHLGDKREKEKFIPQSSADLYYLGLLGVLWILLTVMILYVLFQRHPDLLIHHSSSARSASFDPITIHEDGLVIFRPSQWQALNKRSIPCDMIDLTMQSSERCDQTSEFLIPLLITGTGRSGTAGTAECLRRAGLKFTHDKSVEYPNTAEIHGSVSWYTLFSKRLHGGPKFQDQLFQETVMQVRDPLSSIASRASLMGPVRNAVCCIELGISGEVSKDTLQSMKENEKYIIAMKYWVLWNSFAAIVAREQYQIEKRTALLMKDMWSRFGSTQEKADFTKCETISSKHNSQHVPWHIATTWGRLEGLSREWSTMTKILAKQFGYDVEVDENLAVACRLNEGKKWGCTLLNQASI